MNGNEMETTKIHWAWELKERIKNRRMKLLESLNATRSSKKEKSNEGNVQNYSAFLTEMMSQINKIKAEEVNFTETK